jgi:hypothetical protein
MAPPLDVGRYIPLRKILSIDQWLEVRLRRFAKQITEYRFTAFPSEVFCSFDELRIGVVGAALTVSMVSIRLRSADTSVLGSSLVAASS